MRKQLKEKEYIFNFQSGGWNTVYAKTLRGAIKQAKKEWKDSPSLIVNESSFRLATFDKIQDMCQSFY